MSGAPDVLVLGGHGFLGSAFVRTLRARGVACAAVGRGELGRHAGRAHAAVVHCAGSSRKYLAEADPAADRAQTVGSLGDALDAVRADAWLLCSSGDVYPDPSGPATTAEDSAIDPGRQSTYGRHKLEAERLLRRRVPGALVFRLGGLAGPGLVKGPLHDLATGAALWVNPGSRFGFLDTDVAAGLMWDLLQDGARAATWNLAGRGTVRLSELAATLGLEAAVRAGAPRIIYELSLAAVTRALRDRGLRDEPLPGSRETAEAYLGAAARAPVQAPVRAPMLESA